MINESSDNTTVTFNQSSLAKLETVFVFLTLLNVRYIMEMEIGELGNVSIIGPRLRFELSRCLAN